MAEDKKTLLDASGADNAAEDATATAILRRKKKENGECNWETLVLSVNKYAQID